MSRNHKYARREALQWRNRQGHGNLEEENNELCLGQSGKTSLKRGVFELRIKNRETCQGTGAEGGAWAECGSFRELPAARCVQTQWPSDRG